jgi:hypothetical protein
MPVKYLAEKGREFAGIEGELRADTMLESWRPRAHRVPALQRFHYAKSAAWNDEGL